MSEEKPPLVTETSDVARVLFVDNEPNALSEIKGQLGPEYNLIIAKEGAEAIDLAETHNDIAVIVCQMHLADMNGASLLAEYEKRFPDTVRIMLTGSSTQDELVSLINDGKVFRCLSKPCPEDDLRRAVQDAVQHYEVTTTDKTLLNDTLTGSVRMLVEILSLSVPESFSRASRMRQWVKPLEKFLDLPNRSEIEIAATLSPIGLVAIPHEVLEKELSGEGALSYTEQEMLYRAPESGRNMLAHLPKLKNVSELVYLQDRGFNGGGFPMDGPVGEDIPFGARVLKVLKDLAANCPDNEPTIEAIGKLEIRQNIYDPNILKAVGRVWGFDDSGTSKRKKREGKRMSVIVHTLMPGDLLLSPITFEHGKLLLSPGIRVSEAQIERLKNLQTLEPITEPIQIKRGGD